MNTAAALLFAYELAEEPLLDAAELLLAREEEILLRQEEEREERLEERLPRQGEEEEERPPSPVRVKDYAETIVPLYSGDDFKKHFRMQRETVEVSGEGHGLLGYLICGAGEAVIDGNFEGEQRSSFGHKRSYILHKLRNLLI